MHPLLYLSITLPIFPCLHSSHVGSSTFAQQHTPGQLMALSFDDRVLGEKTQYYCSSSEEEDGGDDAEDGAKSSAHNAEHFDSPPELPPCSLPPGFGMRILFVQAEVNTVSWCFHYTSSIDLVWIWVSGARATVSRVSSSRIELLENFLEY